MSADRGGFHYCCHPRLGGADRMGTPHSFICTPRVREGERTFGFFEVVSLPGLLAHVVDGGPVHGCDLGSDVPPVGGAMTLPISGSAYGLRRCRAVEDSNPVLPSEGGSLRSRASFPLILFSSHLTRHSKRCGFSRLRGLGRAAFTSPFLFSQVVRDDVISSLASDGSQG